MASPTRFLTLMLLALAFARPMRAQAAIPETGSLAITAILIRPLSVSVTNALDFGRMFASTTKTITATGANSGRVEISGEGGSVLSVTLTMPTTLSGVGGTSIPVIGWNYVLGSSANLSTASPVSFSAGSAVPIAATLGGTPGAAKMYLGIGATVQASALAPVGAYTGTGQVTVAYTDL